mmetsp:Transcript_54333/g.141993  ORF Transcript_54333/g.141993 Transcript_54333/m.141993 type:complete len:346 (+) Transcript_54333:584-1621(+)
MGRRLERRLCSLPLEGCTLHRLVGHRRPSSDGLCSWFDCECGTKGPVTTAAAVGRGVRLIRQPSPRTETIWQRRGRRFWGRWRERRPRQPIRRLWWQFFFVRRRPGLSWIWSRGCARRSQAPTFFSAGSGPPPSSQRKEKGTRPDRAPFSSFGSDLQHRRLRWQQHLACSRQCNIVGERPLPDGLAPAHCRECNRHWERRDFDSNSTGTAAVEGSYQATVFTYRCCCNTSATSASSAVPAAAAVAAAARMHQRQQWQQRWRRRDREKRPSSDRRPCASAESRGTGGGPGSVAGGGPRRPCEPPCQRAVFHHRQRLALLCYHQRGAGTPDDEPRRPEGQQGWRRRY